MDPKFQIIQCDEPDKIGGVVNRIVQGLPSDIRRPFDMIKLSVLTMEGVEGLFRRFNGKSVGDILTEYATLTEAVPERSGQVGEFQYQLYGPPRELPQDKKVE